MMERGRYGEIAAAHMARWQPSSYAAIPAADRDAWFADLNDRIGDRVTDLTRSLMPPEDLAESDYREYVGRVQMARRMAEEQVLAELVYLPPEPGLESEDEPEIADNGGWIDRDWNPPQLMLTDEEWQERQSAGDWLPVVRPRRSDDLE